MNMNIIHDSMTRVTTTAKPSNENSRRGGETRTFTSQLTTLSVKLDMLAEYVVSS